MQQNDNDFSQLNDDDNLNLLDEVLRNLSVILHFDI